MKRPEFVLAVMAAGDSQFSPVQIQKMFFLLDRNVSKKVGGRKFKFRPYDYGPFDMAVYQEVDALKAHGLATVDGDGSDRKYGLTREGREQGQVALEKLPEGVQVYAREVADWVRSLSFSELVSAIYRDYPDMKINSVFRES